MSSDYKITNLRQSDYLVGYGNPNPWPIWTHLEQQTMSPIQYACGTGINQFNGMYVHPHLQQGNYLYTQYPNQKPAISVWQCGRVNSIAVKWMENGSWNLGSMNFGGGWM